MRLTILNGSPKGEVSNTMQYYNTMKKHFPDHSYTLFNIGRDMAGIENEPSRLEEIIAAFEYTLSGNGMKTTIIFND